MTERRTVTIPRWWVVAVVIGVFLGIGVLAVVGVSWFRQGERLEAIGERMTELAHDAKEASEANRAMLEEQRQRDAERQPRVDAAIARIVHDNATAHAALLGEIARLLHRPVPTATSSRPPAAPVASRPSPARAAAPSPARAPGTAPTTTVCSSKGKGRCR